MSTILDALRKLEEEKRSRTADVRSRLLLSSTHRANPLRLRRSPWKASKGLAILLGLALVGFVAGAGFMLWSPHPRLAHIPAEGTPSPQVASAPTDVQLSQTEAQSPPPISQQTAVREEPSALEETPKIEDLPGQFLAPPDSPSSTASAIQRSPFVASSPPSQEAAPVVKRSSTPVPTPAAPKLQPGQGEVETTYEVLMPSGATREVKSPPPAPTTAVAPVVSSGTSLSFLQWSSDPEKRIAFLRVNGGPLTLAHEGDTIGGYTVVEIRQDAVELQSGETRMTLRAQ